jgi:DNA-binding protein Fis
LKLSLPVMSLLRVMLQIIEHPLLATIQTHARNVQTAPTKTTAKGRAYEGVAFSS